MQLKEFIENAGRGAVRRLAREIRAHEPDVSRWVSGARPVPVHYGAPIESATGGQVTRKDLFPSTWRTIWPELAEQQEVHS
jgi:DNA-binding transcriptional regulator YdaS (Cro superfamily)